MTTPSRILATAALGTTQPPFEVLEAARLHFLDACGVALAAAATGPVGGVASMATAGDTGGPCTVFGTAGTASAPMAALANGTLMHSLEYDDTHVASVMHGSSVVAPVALAAAQEYGADGVEMLRAYTLGWETLIRIGLAAPGGIQAHGFQGTSAAGPFAAVITAGVLRSVPRDVLVHAVGIAGSMAGGTFAFLREGATVKAAQPGIAAQAGLMALKLAEAGVTGPGDVFEGPAGFYSLFAGRQDVAQRLGPLAETMGSRWYLPEAAFKGLPCCHFIHPFVEALRSILDKGVDARDVTTVHCAVPDGQWAVIAEPWSAKQRPRRANDARWSLPYTLAALLVDGSVDAHLYRGDTNPDIVRMADRVTGERWTDTGYPEVFPARVLVRTAGGDVHEAEVADVRGSVRRPFRTDEVVTKFRRNAELAGWSDIAAQSVIDELLHATAPDLGVLREALSG